MPAFTTTAKTFHETIFFTFHKAFLLTTPSSIALETPKHEMPKCDGLFISLDVYPDGFLPLYSGSTSVFLNVTGLPCYASVKISVESTLFNKSFTFAYNNNKCGFNSFQSHEWFNNLIQGDTITLRCDVALTLTDDKICAASKALPSFALSLCDVADKESCDMNLEFDDELVPVHRAYLSMISSVFHAMFLHLNVDDKVVVKIDGFNKITGKNAINICYGGDVRWLTMVEILSVLQFVDQYKISAVKKKLEQYIIDNVKNDNFFDMTRYAYDYASEPLKLACATHFALNAAVISLNPNFLELDKTIMTDVMSFAQKIVTRV